jgi:hypothetical protein
VHRAIHDQEFAEGRRDRGFLRPQAFLWSTSARRNFEELNAAFEAEIS